MHAKTIKHMLEKLTKMVPKWSQNLSKVEPGGGGTPFGTSLASFGASFFWCFFEVAFWWPWPPFGLPKHLQNETQKGVKPKAEFHWFCLYLHHFSHIWGCWKWSFFDVFLEHRFGIAFGANFDDFGSLLGSLLETILVTFWGTIFASILRPPKNIEKGRESSARPVSIGHKLPPPRTPPP